MDLTVCLQEEANMQAGRLWSHSALTIATLGPHVGILSASSDHHTLTIKPQVRYYLILCPCLSCAFLEAWSCHQETSPTHHSLHTVNISEEF